MPDDLNAPSHANRGPSGVFSRLGFALVVTGLLTYVVFRLIWLNRFMTHVDDFVPMAEFLRQHASAWSWADIVHLSRAYTYPPGQFLLSFPLASFADDYAGMLFWYRLPSLLLWLTGLFLFHRLLRTMWPELPAVITLIPVVLGLLSWRGFIESSQGYNYATTTLITTVITWFVATEPGRAWISRGIGSAVSGGLVLGLLTWLSYQTLFVTAAGLAALFLFHLLQRNYRAAALACVTGAGFVVPFSVVFWLCLRHAMRWASGTPSWAGGTPPIDLAGKLAFPIRAWFEVLQNNLTFIAWGPGSAILAAIATLVCVGGCFMVLRLADQRKRLLPLLLFLGLLGVVFTLGPYLRLFPLGASRHTFVLQVPLLLLLTVALSALRPSRHVVASCLVVIAGLWCWALPGQLDAVRNRVDYDLIASQFARWPDTRITDLPGSCTWETTFLAREDISRLERIRWCVQFPTLPAMAQWLMQSPHALLVSHRGPLGEELRSELLAAGAVAIIPLAMQPPGRGTELKGTLNGGNGFFLYLIER